VVVERVGLIEVELAVEAVAVAVEAVGWLVLGI
jgi:hypothetical protein